MKKLDSITFKTILETKGSIEEVLKLYPGMSRSFYIDMKLQQAIENDLKLLKEVDTNAKNNL